MQKLTCTLAAVAGVTITAPAWGTVGILTGIALVTGIGIGLGSGASIGWNQAGFGAGFDAAISDQVVSTTGYVWGMVVGLKAMHAAG